MKSQKNKRDGTTALKPAGQATTGEGIAPEIRPEQSIELLKELHILTREGKLNQDSRRKLKQVYHPRVRQFKPQNLSAFQ